MTITDVTLQERHLAELRPLVLPTGGAEGAAYVLFGRSRIGEDPWERQARQRFLSYDVVPIPPNEIISAGHDHITWSTASFVRLLKQAKDDGLIAGIVHSHPQGPAAFSEQDDRNEAQLAQLARNRNGAGTPMLSVLLTGNGAVRAQAWLGGSRPDSVNMVYVVGRRLALHSDTTFGQPVEAFARQALAFGETTNANLRKLRVGVVGCGGTGSATALLLARLGVGQIVLFDDDIVESTNLNRLHGARQSDADAMRAKVDVLAREISEMGLDEAATRSKPITSLVWCPYTRSILRRESVQPSEEFSTWRTFRSILSSSIGPISGTSSSRACNPRRSTPTRGACAASARIFPIKSMR